MKIKSRRRRITAAEEDERDNMFSARDDMNFSGSFDDEDGGLTDRLDDVADAVEGIQDTVEQDKEDDVRIEIENNIADHYVAECQKCHGIFISAMVESDQDVQSVSGECPLCGEETEQKLKWIIREVSHSVKNPTVPNNYTM